MNHSPFSLQDLDQMSRHGVSEQQLVQQIENFKSGFAFSNLSKPCFPGDGIYTLNADLRKELVEFYENKKNSKTVVKFVPASGAATRMFKNLFEYLDQPTEILPPPIKKFMGEKEQFAFIHELTESLQKNSVSLASLSEKEITIANLDFLLHEKGLNYGNLPKGLLKFHKYANGETRTPVQEHVAEGLDYARVNESLHIHFTVSPEHRIRFEHHVSSFLPQVERASQVKIKISYSEQKSSTDTVAVDLENNLFREENGQLVFRPAGHGALLENLNDLDADIIFIKNIDNVVPDHKKTDTLLFKKVMAGLLLKIQEKVFEYLALLENNTSDSTQTEIHTFVSNTLGISLPSNASPTVLTQILNRPIRICGMVKSDGNPGGGPFWVKNTDGTEALQIVETAQIDENNPHQKHILNSSTYFNPVDLVCGVKNYKNVKFNLLDYRDPSTGFITKKSKNGKDLKAMELPGLWNGSMAYWNTIFVEVPVSTFAPVKTVNDLLSEEHQ